MYQACHRSTQLQRISALSSGKSTCTVVNRNVVSRRPTRTCSLSIQSWNSSQVTRSHTSLFRPSQLFLAQKHYYRIHRVCSDKPIYLHTAPEPGNHNNLTRHPTPLIAITTAHTNPSTSPWSAYSYPPSPHSPSSASRYSSRNSHSKVVMTDAEADTSLLAQQEGSPAADRLVKLRALGGKDASTRVRMRVPSASGSHASRWGRCSLRNCGGGREGCGVSMGRQQACSTGGGEKRAACEPCECLSAWERWDYRP